MENKSLEELTVLLRYFVSHNESHKDELEELLPDIKALGNKDEVVALLEEALKEYEAGNKKLKEAFLKL